MKLDAQAKELSASQRQAVGTGINRTGMKPPTGELRRPVGTRVSARLRADIAEEEWQPVPAEWLAEERDTTGESSVNKGAAHSSGVDAKLLSKVGLGSDEESISDLTELTEDQDEQNAKIEPDYTENASILAARLKRASELEEQPLPEGFIEWETVGELVAVHNYPSLLVVDLRHFT
jgi:hypothetical protein